MLFISKNLTLGYHVSLILRKMWEIGIFIHMKLCFLSFLHCLAAGVLFSTICSFNILRSLWDVFLQVWNQRFCQPIHSQDVISHSLYCLQYNFYTVSLENLVLDQLIISSLIFFFILITCLLDVLFIWYCKEKFRLGHSWELES